MSSENTEKKTELNQRRKKFGMYWKLLTILVIVLVINLPLVSAIQISGISERDLTETSVIIGWNTDEESDSLVYYGEDEFSLNRVESDPTTVTYHEVELGGLIPGTNYNYYVMSNGEIEDNSGNYYNFQTLGTNDENGYEGAGAEGEEGTDGGTGSATEGGGTRSGSSSLSLSVEHPEMVRGTNVDVTGSTFAGAEVRVYVNGGYHAKEIAAEDGTFQFVNVPLTADTTNTLQVEAEITSIGEIEDSEEVQTYSGEVYSDNTRPNIVLDVYQKVVDEDHVTLKGAISEECSIKIYVNDKSVHTSEGTDFEAEVHLDEGVNEIIIEATDQVEWVTEELIEIEADTEPPEIEAEFEKGNEYYQNRARTDIYGVTEPGSKVYLFVYRPLSYQYQPDFTGPWLATETDENGNFVFETVNFETEPITLEDIIIEEVPAGLEGVTIYPIESVSQAQEWTYHVYLVAYDKSGKGGYWHETVTVHTCYSSNFDFQVTDIAKFQQPLRLNPNLIEEGREVITAVFNLSYLGGGIAQYDVVTGEEIRDAFQVNSVRFEKACTQTMMDDKHFGLGCSILPNEPRVLASPDRTAYYLSWNLYSTEGLKDVDEDLWNDFQKRQLMFPLKVIVNYQEYDSQGNLGESKTQTTCYDLGYYVDIPIESEKMIPDWLAEEGVKALNGTITAIDKILPVLEKVILVTGVTCFVSLGVRTIIRFARIFTSKAEYITTRKNKPEKQCPLDQSTLYLDSTRNKWDKLQGNHPKAETLYKTGYDKEENFLEEKCPNTANIWKAEEALDQAYRWTCDRFLCRPVPARWTEEKDQDEVEAAIATQRGCAVTSGCIPLREVENCGQYVENTQPGVYLGDTLNLPASGPCWERFDNNNVIGSTGKISGTLYHYDDKDPESSIVSEENGIYRLKKISSAGEISGPLGSKATILVYQEANGGYCGAPDKTCKAACADPRNPGYKAVSDGFNVDSSGIASSEVIESPGEALTGQAEDVGAVAGTGTGGTGDVAGAVGTTDVGAVDPDEIVVSAEEVTPFTFGGRSCYKVLSDDLLVNAAGDEMRGNMISAGHTKDCFVGNDGYKYQCVCESDDRRAIRIGSREAFKAEKVGGKKVAEKYSYRQDRIYLESQGLKGTYYPEWRYYDGRDMSGAFGLNYLPDYAVPSDLKKKTKVNPHSQHISTFQTVCLTGIRARLVMLRSILDGLRRCIMEAKYTGFHDAGMCKTLFSQHVCGLIYKLIAAFSGRCSPLSLKDANKGNFTDAAALFSAGTESMYDSMQFSIDDLQRDYGNSKLNEYFATGVQGVAESICMAAFGFDWPMGFDFIEDVAYSVPMRTSVLVFPAFRELTNYNPQTLTAQFNYEVGAVIFPGCRVASYQTYLKCVGPEDLGHPGVSCGDQGCDCLNVGPGSLLKSERVHHLDGGRGSNLEPGSMLELPIEAPQKVDKHFRYDHVVVDLQLDPYESTESCFDQGYRDGKFYFPITDVSPPGVVSCQVEAATGQYSCPELAGLFYSEGLAYLQDPYITCYNKHTDTYADCDTPNMLMSGDPIKVKVHMNTDGGNYCLRLRTSAPGIDEHLREPSYEIPAGPSGFMAPVFEISSVNEEMFGGVEAGLNRVTGESNSGCPRDINAVYTSGMVSPNQKVTFDYEVVGGEYKIVSAHSAASVDVPGAQYELIGGVLTRSDGVDTFSLTDINNIVFSVGNMQVSNVLGSATVGNTQCVYTTQQGRESTYTTGNNVRRISVTAELLQPDSFGNCYSAKERVPTVALGKSTHPESIRVQREHEVEEATSEIFDYFMAGDYAEVINLAGAKIEYLPGDFEEALGIYYYVAAVVMLAGNQWQSKDYQLLLDRFFLRKDPSGVDLPPFKGSDINSAEFQKIRRYLCVIAEKLEYADRYLSSGYNCEFEDIAASAAECIDEPGPVCGKDSVTYCGIIESFRVPGDWSSYSCMNPSLGVDCLAYTQYTVPGKGCPGDYLCCKST